MGKRKPSPPPPPDPVAIANAEKVANVEAARETAKLNAINQYTPFGNVVFQRNSQGIPIAQHTTLSPDQQRLVDLQSDIGVQLGQLAQNQASYIANNQFQLPDTLPQYPTSLGVSTPEFPLGVDTSGLAPIPGANDFSADARRLEDATFSRAMNLLNPEFERQRRQTEQTLFDRGLPQTGEAYTTELNRLDQAQNEARLAAAQEAVRAGRDEQSRLFGQGITARQIGYGEAAQDATMQQQARQQAIAEAAQNAQLAANARQQTINELMLERAQPFNELSAFLQGAPALPIPQAQPLAPIGIQPPNVLGAHTLNANVAMNNYNQQMANRRGINQGFFDLGSSMLSGGEGLPGLVGMFSSRSYKVDEGKPIDALEGVRRIDIQSWRYRPEMNLGSDRHIGPYAEDLLNEFGIGNGKIVPVVDAFGLCLLAIKELTEKVDELEHALSRSQQEAKTRRKEA